MLTARHVEDLLNRCGRLRLEGEGRDRGVTTEGASIIDLLPPFKARVGENECQIDCQAVLLDQAGAAARRMFRVCVTTRSQVALERSGDLTLHVEVCFLGPDFPGLGGNEEGLSEKRRYLCNVQEAFETILGMHGVVLPDPAMGQVDAAEFFIGDDEIWFSSRFEPSLKEIKTASAPLGEGAGDEPGTHQEDRSPALPLNDAGLPTLQDHWRPSPSPREMGNAVVKIRGDQNGGPDEARPSVGSG